MSTEAEHDTSGPENDEMFLNIDIIIRVSSVMEVKKLCTLSTASSGEYPVNTGLLSAEPLQLGLGPCVSRNQQPL